MFEGTVGGVAELAGATRVRGYENDTNIPDKNGIPGHTISLIVEGGQDKEIAEEISLRKTPGCGTYGDIEIPVADIDSPPIRFFRNVKLNES